MLVQDGTGPATLVATKYLSFDMATDTFLATTETVSAAQILTGTAASGWGCSLVVRSNGQVVCFYNGVQTKVSTQWSRVYYRVRTGVNTFAAVEAMVDAGLGVNNTAPIAVLGSSDRTHLLFFNGTNTLQRHLTSANVLGTVASTGATTAVQDAATYDAGGGTIRHVGYTAASAFRWTSADNPTVTNAAVTFGTPVRATDDSGKFYALYQNSTDSDLYVKSSTDNGATFGTGTNVFTATVAAADANLSKNQLIYQRGNNFVIPYIVNDSGTLKYNESTVRSAAVNMTLTADSGSYALTGATTTTALHRWNMVATTPAAYVLTGTDALLTKGAGLVPKKLTADPGSYALTGASTTVVLHKWRPVAADGSYAVTGADAALTRRVNKVLAAAGSSYALTGTAAPVLHKWITTAGTASYALTGAAATLTKAADKILAAGTASYAITGTATPVLHRWKPVAATGSYSLAGTDAGVRHVSKVAAAAGAYSLTGTAVSLPHSWKLPAASDSYALTGADAVLKRISGKFVSANPGSYALTGSATSVLVSRKLAADAGSYAITGTAATVSIGAGEVEPPIFVGGGGIARPPRPYPVEGAGFGILPPIEGEAFGVVVSEGVAKGQLSQIEGQATAAIGAAGSVEGLFTIKAAACGQCVRLGKGFGMIKFEGGAAGRFDDDEAAAVMLLLAA